MCILPELFRHIPQQLFLDFQRVFPRCDPDPVGNTENMGIHCYCWFTKCCIQYYIGGLASNTSRLFGTSPPCCSSIMTHSLMIFSALVLYRPIVLIKVFSWSTPISISARGVFATLYNSRVALFTLISVACAESTTETSNSNTVAYSSSVVGEGFWLASASKIAVHFFL